MQFHQLGKALPLTVNTGASKLSVTASMGASPGDPPSPQVTTTHEAVVGTTTSNITVHVSGSKSGKRLYDKVNMCLYCGKSQLKISRHLVTRHKDEWQVKEVDALTSGSQERLQHLEKMRLRGNYKHNIQVLRTVRNYSFLSCYLFRPRLFHY